VKKNFSERSATITVSSVSADESPPALCAPGAVVEEEEVLGQDAGSLWPVVAEA
jgi:hypothetical protein